MNIDFTKDMSYWTNLIKEFLKVISEAFGWFGIKLFTDSGTETATEPAIEEEE